MNIDLSQLSTPQLREMKRILEAGVRAKAEAIVSGQLCHKSPPKGYPKEKSQYGDPECYRYPLNTKERCVAAWRYVHQANNKSILSSKFKKVESKIKNYGKSHYSLDLQVGESEEFNWEQAFLEYYDAETMGERCENIVLEIDSDKKEDNNMEINEKEFQTLQQENADLKKDKDTLTSDKTVLEGKVTDLETKASQVDSLTEELTQIKEEVETLRQFKVDTEKAAEIAQKTKDIRAKLEEAGIEVNLDDEKEAEHWLGMSDESLTYTISKMVELKKGAKASASVKVPNLSNPEDEQDAVGTVREGLKKMKEGK